MTVAEILSIAEVSQYLASNAIDNAGLFGGGEDLMLPRKLYAIRKNVERLYGLDPSDDTLFQTSRYLYALCGKYKFKAASVTGTGGSVVPIIPNDTDCMGLTTVTADMFEADGKTYFNADWSGKVLQIFWNNVNRFIDPPEWSYVAGGGFKILLPDDFDANTLNTDAVFKVFIGCFNPGALFIPNPFPINEFIIIPAGYGASYDLAWTAYYQNKYGTGSFLVYQDDGSGVFEPSAIEPVADNDDNPTIYTFPINDLRTKIILN